MLSHFLDRLLDASSNGDLLVDSRAEGGDERAAAEGAGLTAGQWARTRKKWAASRVDVVRGFVQGYSPVDAALKLAVALLVAFSAYLAYCESCKEEHYAMVLALSRALRYGVDLCCALRYCHQDLRIVHRDLKPANVLIDEIGTMKLADFGLSKSLDVHTDLCATFCGSPLYMSPEQAAGQALDHYSDIYSLGAILYQILSGRMPYTGTSAQEIIKKVLLFRS